MNRRQFEPWMRELLEGRPALLRIASPVLRARSVLLEEYNGLDRVILQPAQHGKIC